MLVDDDIHLRQTSLSITQVHLVYGIPSKEEAFRVLPWQRAKLFLITVWFINTNPKLVVLGKVWEIVLIPGCVFFSVRFENKKDINHLSLYTKQDVLAKSSGWRFFLWVRNKSTLLVKLQCKTGYPKCLVSPVVGPLLVLSSTTEYKYFRREVLPLVRDEHWYALFSQKC